MLKALKAVEVPAVLVVVKNAGHGFAPEGGAIEPKADAILDRSLKFFEEKLAPKVVVEEKK